MNQSNEIVEVEDIITTYEGCPTENAGKGKICQGCPGQEACKTGSKLLLNNPDQKQLEIRMKAIKHKILVIAGKGGVGKSSMTAQLALSLKNQGKSVAILDVDICGPSIPTILNAENKQIINESYGWIPVVSEHGINVMSVGFMIGENSPIVWRGPRKTHLIKRMLKDTYWGKLDYLLIDTPPGTSDEHLSVIASLKSSNPDGAIILTTPQDVSLITVKKEINFCHKMKLTILGIIENMSGYKCPCCNEITNIFSKDGGKKLSEAYNIPFLGKIPIDTNLGICTESGKSLVESFSESSATKAIQEITETILTF